MENIVKVQDAIVNNSEVEIPYKITVRLLNKKHLKAVAKLEFAGFIIADIKIIESNNRTIVEYPSKEFVTSEGETKKTSVCFPSNKNTSRFFNKAILTAYTDACFEQNGQHFVSLAA